MSIKKNHVLKCFSLVLILGLLISCGSSPGTAGSQSPSSPSSSSRQPSDVQSRLALYRQYLQGEGYRPSIDEDGFLSFSVQDINFYIYINETDPSFTEIFLPNLYVIGSDSDRAKVAEAVSYANNVTKVGKAYINDQYVFIAVEIYLENPNDFSVLFSRILNAMIYSVQNFSSKM